MLVVNAQIQIPEQELQLTFSRSSGPGGQNVNKVNSRAILTWSFQESKALPGAVRDRFVAKYGKRLSVEGHLQIARQRYRDQPRNIADCRERLVAMIQSVVAPPIKRKPSAPSYGARQRRLQEKRVRSGHKESRRKPGMD